MSCLEPEIEQTKDTTDAPVEDTPKPSDEVMPKEIGELEGDGDASATSQPDGTDLESPKVAEKSVNDADDITEAPREDEPKDVDTTPATPDPLTEADGQEAKQGTDAQDSDIPKDIKIEESLGNDENPAEPSEQKSELPTDATSKDEPKSSLLDTDDTKDVGNSAIDLPERPKPETESEEPSDGIDKAPEGSLLDGVDPATVDKAEEKREVEPSHPEAQESPITEQDSTPAQPSEAPKDSLLDAAEAPQVAEADKSQPGNDKGMIQSLYQYILAFVQTSIIPNIPYLLRSSFSSGRDNPR